MPARSTTFTTYFNYVEDPQSSRNLDRFTNRAIANYATITRAADQASAAAAGLIGGRGFAGGRLNQDLRQRETLTRGVTAASERAAAASAQLTRATKAQGDEAQAAARKNSNLVRSLEATAVGLNVVQGPLGPLAGRVRAVSSAFEELTGFRLGLVGVGAALFSLGQTASSFTEIESKLRPLFTTQRQVNDALDDVAGIARRARTSLEPVADLYNRLTLAGREFGFSQERVGRLTELATKAATLSGGSRQSREAGLSQFAQGIGSGNLGGDELKSIKENTLVLAQQIAAGFKNADGSIGTTIGKLKELGSEGKLTSNDIADALERSARRIDTAYARLPKTLSTSGAEIKNALLIDVGRFDQAIGFTNTLAEGLSLVAQNMRVIISLGAGVATTFAVFKAVDFAKQIGGQAAAAIATARQVKELDAAWLAETRSASQAAAARVAELEAERAEIRRTIVEIERKRAAEQANVTRLTPLANDGSAARQRLYQDEFTEATRRLNQQQLALAHTQSELTRVNRDLKGAVVQAEGATTRFGVATENVAKRTGLWRGALNGILGVFGGPWGLALTAATTALYLFATAETNAERATRLHEDAQRDFATIIDQTTGKIYGQITALEVLGKKKAVNESLQANGSQFISQRNSLADALQGFGGANRDSLGRPRRDTPEEAAAKRELSGLAQRVRKNQFTYQEVDQTLQELGKRYKGIRDRLPEFGKRLSALRESGERVLSDAAAVRLGTAQERPTDSAVVRGILTPAQARAQRKTSDLDKQAAAEAKLGSGDPRQQAQGRRDQALIELEKQRANGLADDQYLSQRKQILQTYDQEIQGIKGARAAQSAANKEARAEAAQAKRDAKEAERERIQTAKEDAQARLEAAQTDLEERRPGLSTQQYLDARLKILQTYDDEYNAIDKTAQRSHKAADQELRDKREAAAALRDIDVSFERELQVSGLLLQGREAEANATRRMLELVDRIGDAGYAQYDNLLAQERTQQRINDRLASRERITSAILGTVDAARDGFEQLLVDLPSKGLGAGKEFLRNIQASINRSIARRFTETLFAGADEKVRNLLLGQNSVDSATDRFATSVDQTSSASARLAQAMEEAAKRIKAAAENVSPPDTAGAVPSSSFNDGAPLDAAAALTGIAKLTADYIASDEGKQRAARLAGQAPDVPEIVVTATKVIPQVVNRIKGTPGQQAPGSALFETAGNNVDKIFGTQFFGKMGKTFGQALDGAGQGAIASGFVKALGIKQSKTGAQIGGAIGSFIPGVGPIIGGIIGGTLGGLFKKTKTGTATIGNVNGATDITGTGGNSAGFRKEASGIASTVGGTVDQIVQQLGASLGDFSVSIGKRNKKFVVDPTGKGRTKGAGVLKFDSVEEAEQSAIRTALTQGAAKGISQAAQNILNAGKDLQTSVEKAALIESIPRRLLQRLDPVRYAVEELNREYERTIAVLKEGGASAAQFADAQKLYELERADAVKQATEQAAGAIDQFLKDMVGSSNSPLNKRDTYGNASTALDAFRADINSGKVVDQNELLSAARNFQDASRSLNGSSQAFFDDFEALRALLTKARDNAGITNVSTLPGSPFSTDASVQQAIANMNSSLGTATNNQTATIKEVLERIYTEIRDGGIGFSAYEDITRPVGIQTLPGFR